VITRKAKSDGCKMIVALSVCTVYIYVYTAVTFVRDTTETLSWPSRDLCGYYLVDVISMC